MRQVLIGAETRWKMSKRVAREVWVLQVNFQGFADRIVDGRKTIEVRDFLPSSVELPVRIVVVERGWAKAVVTFVETRPFVREDMPAACVEDGDLERYASLKKTTLEELLLRLKSWVFTDSAQILPQTRIDGLTKQFQKVRIDEPAILSALS